MSRLSLRTRLLLLTASLLLAGLGLAGAVVSDQLERHQVGRIDTQLRSLGAILSSLPPTAPLGVADSAPRLDLLDPALSVIGAPYLAYLDADGALVRGLHSGGQDGAGLPSPDALSAVPVGGDPSVVPAADGSGRWRAVARSTNGWDGTVVVAASLAEADATTDRLRATSLVSGGVLLVLLTAVGWFALHRGLRPLRRIEQTAAAIAGGDLTSRVPVLAAPSTEVGRLAASLNTMLGQLEQAFADRAASETRMRTFLSDVSHELRTPLFGIKGSTDLYRMGAMADRADVDEAMLRIGREATRLTGLTEDLLLLARLDEAPAAQLDREPMDLRTLANDARHDLLALDRTRRVELTGPGGTGPPGPAPVLADENALRQVVTNLIGNAATYTPAGTEVRVGVGTVGGRAVLEVADRGPGMAEHQAARVFDRFYRADHSRAGANSGLGLAIARAIARAHDGDLELETALGEGACFRLALPLDT